MTDPIETLARWLHYEAGEGEQDWTPWKDVVDVSKARYREVARRLLEKPPAVLRRALLGKETKE